jgi:hypothetical protein
MSDKVDEVEADAIGIVGDRHEVCSIGHRQKTTHALLPNASRYAAKERSDILIFRRIM